MSRPRKKSRHLPPCVHEKHGAFYYVKKNKWTLIGKNLTDALIEYSRIVDTPKGGMDKLVDDVLNEIKPKLAKNTVIQYEMAADRLKTIFAEFSPEQIKPKHVAAIKTALSKTPNMANRILSFLRVVFSYAVEWQLVDSNPCIGIKRHAEKKRGRYIADAEYNAIYSHCNERMQIIMDLCYYTGQRIGDVLQIHRSDLTDDGILFNPEKTRNSSGSKLLVRWSPGLVAAVERAKALQGRVHTLTLLFNRKRKAPDYGTTKYLWDLACKAARVDDAHIHDLRAKSLTDAKRQGKDPQVLGNHSSAQMTDRYIRIRDIAQADGPSIRLSIESGKIDE